MYPLCKVLRQSTVLKQFQLCLTRKKHKSTHWSVVAKKVQANDKALQHFDEFYQSVFGDKWPTLRANLLRESSKYMAVVNNFSDGDEISARLEKNGCLNLRRLYALNRETKSFEWLELKVKKKQKENMVEEETNDAEQEVAKPSLSLADKLSDATFDTSRIAEGMQSPVLYEYIPATRLKGKEDWVEESQHYKYYSENDEFPIPVEMENELNFPEHLKVYCFEKRDNSAFKPPRKGVTSVLDYYCMDGGSILPVLALGLRAGDHVLDLCSAPGGKAYVALQTLLPQSVQCNDVQSSRINRINSVLRQYFYDLDTVWLDRNRIRISQIDGRIFADECQFVYDRVLVDVPCTTDRHTLHEPENNIFNSMRIRERLKLPELQAELLVNAIKLIRIGGTVVYSTCSLSPIQNDGVVHMALKTIWETTNIKFVVKDLTMALAPLYGIYKFMDVDVMRYGQLVLPWNGMNYGPTYFCKIVRVG